MKWSLQKQDYEFTHFLYTNFNIGIPATFIYAFPKRQSFSSVEDFTNNSEELCTTDQKLRELLILFKSSKWQKLPLWNNLWGYTL